jgi:endoglucanase
MSDSPSRSSRSFGTFLQALSVPAFATLLGLAAVLLPATAEAQSYKRPVISSFTPGSGPVGSQITITGSNFTGVNRASVDAITATVLSVSSTRVVIVVPAGAVQGSVKVMNPRYVGASSSEFTVTASGSLPTVGSFSPASGPVGTTVTVSGSNLGTVTSARIGTGSSVPVTVVSPSSLRFVVPSDAASGTVTVTSASGSASSAASYTVTVPVSAPVIGSFSPASGPAGTTVTVSGSDLDKVTSAQVGGSATTAVTIASASSLSFVVPADAGSGTVRLNSPNGPADSAASYTVTGPQAVPVVSGFSPMSGPVGTTVTVSGSDFTGATGARIGSGTTVPVTVANSSSLSFVVPSGSTSGVVTVTTPAGSDSSSTSYTVSAPPVAEAPISEHIVVDQFGYRPSAVKTAVIRSPSVGYDSGRPYTPGGTYRVVRASDRSSVLQGTPAIWNGGAVDASSGDAAWWFDFTSVQAPGIYYVLDVEKNLRSPDFEIGEMVYQPALKAALRTFFYQRAGFAKRQPYAEACWTDEAAFLKANQDSQARDVTDRGNAAKVRDLSGGWFDAGDSNKYVTYAVSPVHQLLAAQEENPAAFTDDFNIPESGNGVPDVIDEVKWEIDWLKKMQNPDGSALLKVGIITYNETVPPSASNEPRYYVPTCTSATVAVAGMFAHAALSYQPYPSLAGEVSDLRSRSIAAYDRFAGSATRQTACDDGTVKYGDADRQASEQDSLQTVAAIYLYALTGEARFHDRVKSSYRALRPYRDSGWNRYESEQGSALLYYTTLPQADATLKATILADKRNDASNTGSQIYGLLPNADPYQAFLNADQYHWGSHQIRANYGNTNAEVLSYNIAVSNPAAFETRAEDTLHYFHGVNPFGMVYLSNVNALGPSKSLSTIYHQAWFQDNHPLWDDLRTSSCGPAPGYVPGGPNASAQANGVPSWLTPPTAQPRQKAYLEWNSPSEAAYAVTEPAIYYQAAYVKLVSSFVRR